MAGRTSLELRAERDVFSHQMSVPKLTRQAIAPVFLARDPFFREGDGGGLPSKTPALSGSPVVRAVVTGRDAAALVEDGATTRIVRPGDTVGGRLVTAIDERGIHFQPVPVAAPDAGTR